MANTKIEDGIISISQSRLIALQRESRLLKQKAGQVRSQMAGQYLSSFKGRGMEYDESRPYQPGDDIRSMDWRVTARSSKPHSKVFREERERPVILWVDFRASMFFGTQHCFKSVQAAKLAALLAWQASQNGDRLGGLIYSDTRHFELRPGRGKAAALHLIKQLAEFSQAEHLQKTTQVKTNNKSEHALTRLQKVARPGSMITLISDFRFDLSALESALIRLGRHNEVVLVHVNDPLESVLPESGHYRVSNGVEDALIDAGNSSFRDEYESRYSSHEQSLQALCLKSGASYRSLSTSQSVIDSLVYPRNSRKNTGKSNHE